MIYQYHQGEQFDSKSAAETLLAEAMPKLTKSMLRLSKKTRKPGLSWKTVFISICPA